MHVGGDRGHHDADLLWPGQLERVRRVDLDGLVDLTHSGPLLDVVSWRAPNSYLTALAERGLPQVLRDTRHLTNAAGYGSPAPGITAGPPPAGERFSLEGKEPLDHGMRRTLMPVTRAEVVQEFLSLYEAPRYLEVGVSKGVTFHELTASRKVAVDPHFRFDVPEAEALHPEATYHKMTSDEYFGTLAAGQFEVIFLDGLHTLEQTLRDLTSALEYIAHDGVIVIDDVLPISYFASMPSLREFKQLRAANFVKRGSWMGDVFRLVFFIDTFFQQLSFRTVEENHGQLIAWKSARAMVRHRGVEEVARLPYERVLSDAEVFNAMPLRSILDEVMSWRSSSSLR
jgi:hypothetical protein